MEKIAQLSKYLPKAALGLLGAGGLYGAYKALQPRPTMWDKIKEYGQQAGEAVMPSIQDFASDLTHASMNNPALLNAMVKGMPGQIPGQMSGMDLQMMPDQQMMNQQMMPDQLNFSELQGLQSQLQDLNPYTGLNQYQY